MIVNAKQAQLLVLLARKQKTTVADGISYALSVHGVSYAPVTLITFKSPQGKEIAISVTSAGGETSIHPSMIEVWVGQERIGSSNAVVDYGMPKLGGFVRKALLDLISQARIELAFSLSPPDRAKSNKRRGALDDSL